MYRRFGACEVCVACVCASLAGMKKRTTELEFFYDESGNLYALLVRDTGTNTESWYFYVTNLQGDVVMLLDAGGSVVAEYSYNAWGEVLTTTGTLANVNPIRYRGYYYDAETGLYYVSSRYYDPEICRWINADEQDKLLLHIRAKISMKICKE